MSWVKSNEYTSTHDRLNPSRIYLETDLKPKKLQTYKIQNVGKPIFLDNVSRNQSRLTSVSQKSGRAVSNENYGEGFYVAKNLKKGGINSFKIAHNVVRGEVVDQYGPEEDVELLNDSW